MINRLIGVLTLKAPVYKEIAEDATANGQAAIIVIVAAILSAIGGYTGAAALATQLGAPAPNMVAVIVQQVAGGLIGWAVGSWLLSFVAKTIFKGDTSTGEMLRVNGYTRAFGLLGILGIIPVLGAIIGFVTAILGIIGNIIGIREAAGFDTTKAILTAVIAGVITFLIVGLVAGVIGGLLGAGSALAPVTQ